MSGIDFSKIKGCWKSHRKKILLIIFSVIFCCAVVIAMVSVFSPREDGIKYLIGVSQPNMSDNFQLELYKDIEYQCKQYQSVRFVSYDAGHSTEKQESDIEDLLKLGVDALIIVSFEPDNIADSIKKAYLTGIPVIIIGYSPSDKNYTLYIYTDNKKIGKMAGEYVGELSNGRKCTVLEIQGEPYSKISIDLKNGFFEGIGSYENITKEYVMTGYWSQEKTRARMYESEFFSKEPTINVIFAHSDMMALGAAVNLKQTRKSAYIISVGGYSEKNSDLIAIEEGMINATLKNATGGVEAVDAAMKIMSGEQVPKEIELEPHLVNEDNIDEFLKKEGTS